MKVRLDEMTWPEIKEILNKSNALIIPLGSTEEHGTHLPLNVDSVCATYMAEQAAAKCNSVSPARVLVAPTVDYTDVSIHKMFPGTVGVKADTLVRVLTDIVTGFLEQGFNNIILFSSHNENNCPMEMALRAISADKAKANLVAITSLGLGFDVRSRIVKAGVAGLGHALEIETSMSLVLQPENVRLEKAKKGSRRLPLSARYIGETGADKSKGVVYYTGITGFEKSGTYGNPTLGSKEEGEEILGSIINDLADIISQAVDSGRRAPSSAQGQVGRNKTNREERD